MKAWRFYGFGDMRLDDVPDVGSEARARGGRALVSFSRASPRPSSLSDIPTLAYESIKRRLETEAPVQLFGHEFCAGDRSW